MKLILFYCFFLCTFNLISQNSDTFNIDNYTIEITHSANFTNAIDKLHLIRTKKVNTNGDSVFTILHFGDSHIQGDNFSGEIRNLLQTFFGNAGQGMIFPYSICKSYGPKGVLVSPKGLWNSANILKNTSKKEIGLSGYTISTINPFSTLDFTVSDKFKGEKSNSISIWTSCGNTSFDYKVNQSLSLFNEKKNDLGWMVRSYKSDSIIDSFQISLNKINDSNKTFNFQGFQYNSNSDFGINYHHCGVVGAQFTHLIYNSELIIDQINYLKPDLIIFSFGTNEAYNQSIDTSFYYNSISKFISSIQNLSPETAFLITTAPDTRSQGKTPPNQVAVNNQLLKLSKNLKLSLFDLNEAMGGWGSLYKWYNNNLTLKDKLHFNAVGYALQGKMLTYALLKYYNRNYKNEEIILTDLKNKLEEGLKPILYNIQKTELSDSHNINITVDSNMQNQKKNVTYDSKIKIYTVKKGDSIYAISKKNNSSVKKILDANKLKENSVIIPGQKLIIPLN